MKECFRFEMNVYSFIIGLLFSGHFVFLLSENIVYQITRFDNEIRCVQVRTNYVSVSSENIFQTLARKFVAHRKSARYRYDLYSRADNCIMT